MVVFRGGHRTYGQAVGIIMLDTVFPRVPGDIGNHSTFPFPVLYKIVPGATARRVCLSPDPALLEPFTSAARELEAAGVRAITTSCGFLAIFHRYMVEAVRVPVVSSSLIQVPMVSRMVGGKPVGIITAHESSLTDEHFKGVGWSVRDVPVVIKGLDHTVLFSRSGDEQSRLAIDFDLMRRQVVEAARQMVEERPDVAAIVLECTNLPPYAADIQQAADRPVFSIVSLVKMMYSALERREYVGHM